MSYLRLITLFMKFWQSSIWNFNKSISFFSTCKFNTSSSNTSLYTIHTNHNHKYLHQVTYTYCIRVITHQVRCKLYFHRSFIIYIKRSIIYIRYFFWILENFCCYFNSEGFSVLFIKVELFSCPSILQEFECKNPTIEPRPIKGFIIITTII